MNKMARKTTVLALAIMMLLSIAMTAGASTPIQENSKANIDFEAGQITINPNPDPNEVAFNPMLLQFGRRTVPIRAETYVANGDSGTYIGTSTTPTTQGAAKGPEHLTEAVVGILVVDPRATNDITGWTYTAKMTQFRNVDNTAKPNFNAVLRLAEGVPYTNADASKLGTALTVNNDADDQIVIRTGETTETILLTATTSMGRGSHGATWTNEKIFLDLLPAGADASAGGFDVIENNQYQATMTWTLNVL